MKRRIGLIATAVMVCCCLAATAGAGTIAQHLGQNDPAAEGFTLYKSGPVSTLSGNDGYDYWELTTTAGKQGYYLDNDVTEADFEADPSGWTATFKVRAISGRSAGRGSTIMYVDDGDYLIDTCIIDGTGSYARGLWLLLAGSSNWVHLGDLDPTVYHTYQTVYDPVTDNSIVSIYVDGSLFATRARSDLYVYTAGAYFGFGDGSSSADPVSNVNRWSEATLETGVNIVPEPSSAMLLISAFLGLLIVGRRRGR